ncbi:hemin uptake protein HemP [Ramlibacter sp.]|jgi:hemin uptake protein HemP|uniref:hemin uptake protein HemP n=1 Tax=Ramlibacter sp. TaxID=1917967 RepID=UPI002FCC9024|nr:hemP [Ramlibacter sp.]MCE3272661.1 hemP [Ramlibacter sp.]
MRNPQPHPAAAARPADRAADAARRPPLASEELLRGGRLVEIAHNGEIYRLQATRLGKLILTK